MVPGPAEGDAAGAASAARSRLRRLVGALIERDAAGRSWLGPLLAATPLGADRLGRGLVEEPGWLVLSMAMRTASGALGCFEQPAPPPAGLLRWFIDHADELVWPESEEEMTPEFRRLRRALVADEPPGARARAQDRARELAATRTGLAPEWWRFEGMTTPDCVLITPRLVVTILAADTRLPPPPTPWYPARTALVRSLEAASQIAQDRRFATLVLSDGLLAGAEASALDQTLPAGTPHLTADERERLRGGYLGGLTWEQARQAVGTTGG